MGNKVFTIVILLIALLLCSCRGPAQPEPEATVQPTAAATESSLEATQPAISIPDAEPDATTPAGAVEAFYTWYLDPQRRGDVLESPYLSQRQIEAVTRLSEGRRMGADPFLLAQEVPAAIRVEEVTRGVAMARVVLHQYWNLDVEAGAPTDRTIDLVREGGAWKIDRIQTGSPLTPEGVVELFYNWYFQYGEPDQTLGAIGYALASSGNPLVDNAYRHSPYLEPAFISQVDTLLAEFEDSPANAIAYDPFLRARNQPLSFYVMVHELKRDGSDVRVPVQLTYGRQQTTIDVTVRRIENNWQITAVSGELPDDAETASQVVDLFCGRYLNRWYAYVEDEDLDLTGEINLGPFLVQQEEMYRRSPFLTSNFAAGALEKLANGNDSTDPFFQATTMPATLEFEDAWSDGDHAEVRILQRWHLGHESRPITVQLRRQDGRWLIDGVIAAGSEALAEVDARAEMHPADVVRAFFSTYLAQGGFAGGAHRDNDYLSPGYVQTIESDADYYAGIGIPVEEVDPILHSASSVVPDAVRVDVLDAVVDEVQHRALVRADRIYTGGASLPLTVMLAREWDDHWTIVDVGALDFGTGSETGAEIGDAGWLGLAVASWYRVTLAYRTQPEAVNALPSLLGFDMEAPGGITFCTTTWPLAFAVESVFLEPGAERGAQRARMVLSSTEPHALLTLELEQREWRWAIVDQVCGDSPEGRAMALYTAYLSAQRSGVQARAYARDDFLTSDLIMSLDALRDASTVDPLTNLQEGARWFEMQAGATANSAVVNIVGVEGGRQQMDLTFVLVEDRWLLSNVRPAD